MVPATFSVIIPAVVDVTVLSLETSIAADLCFADFSSSLRKNALAPRMCVRTG